MDATSPLPTASDPTANSPSDLSYSSGTSRTSTRDTSPDSVAAISSSQPSSPLLDLNLNGNIEHTPNTLPERQPKMDRNPFQSVNDRRNKLATERGQGNQVQTPQQPQNAQQQQQNFQPQTLRSSMQPLNIAPRSLVSSNWRMQAGEEVTLLARSGEYTQFDPPIGHHMQHGASIRPLSLTSPRMEQFQHHQHHEQQQQQQTQPQPQQLSSIMPYSNTRMISELQLDASYAYCYDRGNGQYTRLIPADMLPPLKDVSAVEQSCSGMMVLPQPRALPPNGRSSNTEAVVLRSTPNTPSSPSDTIQVSQSVCLNSPPQRSINMPFAPQSRIDTIVASTPPTPTHPHSSMTAAGLSGSSMGPAGSSNATTAQIQAQQAQQQQSHPHHNHHAHHHHPSHGHSHSHAHSHTHPHQQQQQHHHQPTPLPSQQQQHQQPATRRPKIYCDKWVHEGVCAFTQQGCKYKHEMPFDKVTQHQLGLFHGFPAWWKKHQADLSRQRDAPVGAGAMMMGGGGIGGGAAEDQGRLGVGVGVGGGERFMGRGAPPPPAAGSTAGSTAADGAPLGTGLPTWRRSGGSGSGSGGGSGGGGGGSGGGGSGSSEEQKAVGSGRGMTRGVGTGVRGTLASYSSPFGPIAPPTRTSTATPALRMADLSGAGQNQGQTGGAALKTGGGGGGGNTAGIPTANPYSSLESLDERASAKGEEQQAMGSSGARLT